MKFLHFFLCLVLSWQAFAIEFVSDPTPGKWCRDINKCIEFSDLHAIPLLAIWGRSSCAHCVQLYNHLAEPEFTEWAERRKILMCFNFGTTGDDAFNFCIHGSQKLTSLPLVCVYTPRFGASPEKNNFTGMAEYLPVRDTADTFLGCLIRSVEKYLGDYQYADPSLGPIAFKSVGSDQALAVNPWLYRKLKTTIPMFANEDDRCRLVGLLSLSVAKNNRISARYCDSEGKVTFSGQWSSLNLITGEASCTMCKGNDSISVTLLPNGELSAWSADATGKPIHGSSDSSVDLNLAEGSYVVSFRTAEQVGGYGTLLLDCRSSKASVKGILPDGTSVSGNIPVVFKSKGVFCIPVFLVKSNRTLSISICVDNDENKIRCDASSFLLDSRSCCETPLEVNIGKSLKGLSADEICEQFSPSLPLILSARVEEATDFSDSPLMQFADSTILPSGTKFVLVGNNTAWASFALQRQNGAFSGKIAVLTAEGKTTAATVKGYFSYPCEEFIVGYGTAFFKQSVNGKSGKRSLPIKISFSNN